MDRFSGLLDVAEALGIIKANGAWKVYKDKKFYAKNFSEVQDEVLADLIANDDGTAIHVEIDEGTDDTVETREALLARKLKLKEEADE